MQYHCWYIVSIEEETRIPSNQAAWSNENDAFVQWQERICWISHQEEKDFRLDQGGRETWFWEGFSLGIWGDKNTPRTKGRIYWLGYQWNRKVRSFQYSLKDWVSKESNWSGLATEII